MARLPRFASAVSAVALASSMIAGCAVPTARSGSAMKGRNSDVALALRAQMALGAGDFSSAVNLAERAVENSPRDATVRMLLANAYFASGRFASAEAAYRDCLALAPSQSQVILKLALVQIAQGKNGEALAQLESARGYIEAADHGLALALAGQPYEAVQVLEMAARARGADARVRQNLALAHALSGDWTAARTIAAQDLSPDLVDARVQQWMALARPVRASDQVAALVGVTPAASDPGQPVRLALHGNATRTAEVQASTPAPTNQVSMAAPAPVQQVAMSPAAPAEQLAAAESAPAFAEPVAQQAPAPIVETAARPDPLAPSAASGPAAQAVGSFLAAATDKVMAAPAALAEMVNDFVSPPKRRPASARKAKPSKPALAVHRATGTANAVVQLGAYRSRERVSVAWNLFTKRHPGLSAYEPVIARFHGPQGTVYRLSVKGFATQKEAIARCSQLRNRGGNCFVRSVAGDAPVQFASR